MGKTCNCKDAILDAAQDVVAEMGAAHLSLDAVAQKAGVSKGGLLYHYPSKQALLRGMVERLVNKYFEDMEREEKKWPAGPGRRLKASVMTCLALDEKMLKVRRSMIAAIAHEKVLLEPVEQAYREHIREMKGSGLSFEKSAIVSLACDGLIFWEMLGLSVFSPAERKSLVTELLGMVERMERGK